MTVGHGGPGLSRYRLQGPRPSLERPAGEPETRQTQVGGAGCGPVDALPEPLEERLTEVLGREELSRVMAAVSRPAVRVNTLVSDITELGRRLLALGLASEPVPFAPDEALFVQDPEDRGIGNVWEHQAGMLFSQDAASLLPVLALSPQPGERVLDLCAAPGGKTSHIAQRMEDTGLVVGNDPNPGRLNNMASNLDRMGVTSVVVTRGDGVRTALPVRFDRVLVDAPCSNLGGIHHDKAARYAFSEGRVSSRVGLQRGLLETAFHACREGGTVVYSTCTLEPRENEAIVAWFLDHFPVSIEPHGLDVKGRAPLETEGASPHPEGDRALRLHPGDAGTDGFFLARFTKDADAEPGRLKAWRRRASPVEPTAPEELDALTAHYGLEDALPETARLYSTGTKRFLGTAPELGDVLALGPERVGLYAATPEARGPRLSFEAATRFGRETDRDIALSPGDARAHIVGDGVPAVGAETWTLLTCEGEPIGCSRDFGAELPSYVPKQRRVPREGPYVGFLA